MTPIGRVTSIRNQTQCTTRRTNNDVFICSLFWRIRTPHYFVYCHLNAFSPQIIDYGLCGQLPQLSITTTFFPLYYLAVMSSLREDHDDCRHVLSPSSGPAEAISVTVLSETTSVQDPRAGFCWRSCQFFINQRSRYPFCVTQSRSSPTIHTPVCLRFHNAAAACIDWPQSLRLIQLLFSFENNLW